MGHDFRLHARNRIRRGRGRSATQCRKSNERYAPERTRFEHARRYTAAPIRGAANARSLEPSQDSPSAERAVPPLQLCKPRTAPRGLNDDLTV